MADISKIILPDNNEYNLKDAKAQRIWYGSCSTTSTSSTKEVNISGFTSDDLKNGNKIVVRFTTAQDYNGMASLNVTSTGAKSIYYTDSTTSTKNAWAANAIITFIYYNSAWYMDRQDYAKTSDLSNYLTLADLPIYDGTVI